MKATYKVVGNVRGKISSGHRTLSGAVRSMRRDDKACRALGGGSYSDARVIATIDGDDYRVPVLLDSDGTYELGEWPDNTPDAVISAVLAD